MIIFWFLFLDCEDLLPDIAVDILLDAYSVADLGTFDLDSERLTLDHSSNIYWIGVDTDLSFSGFIRGENCD